MVLFSRHWFWKVDSSCSILVKMGCNESRCRSSAGSDKVKETVVYTHETEEFLKDVHEAKCFISSADCRSSVPPPVSRAVLDFAQRMSEDIVAQALQLCWEVEIRYKELPFIDAECDYIIWTDRSFLPGVWLHLDTKCVANEAGENARLSSEPLILEECSCSSQTFCPQLKNVFVISSHCKTRVSVRNTVTFCIKLWLVGKKYYLWNPQKYCYVIIRWLTALSSKL